MRNINTNKSLVLAHFIGGLFILLMITIFTSLAFCQGEVKPIGAPSFTLRDMEGRATSLESYYSEAKAVVVFL